MTLAKQLKPYSDGEMLKEWLKNVVGILCTEKKDFTKISLSRQTVIEHVLSPPPQLKITSKVEYPSLNFML